MEATFFHTLFFGICSVLYCCCCLQFDCLGIVLKHSKLEAQQKFRPSVVLAELLACIQVKEPFDVCDVARSYWKI